jgi:hypothetical protein
MAFPTLYIDTGGHAQGSGSRDSATPIVSGATGASVSGTTVTLAGSPDLSTVATDGSDTIYIADATNSNQLIFRITGVDDGADTVTVDTAPTGSIANSAWGIGGQFVNAYARFTGALNGGWTAQYNNSPAALSGVFTMPRAGSATDGYITIKGKAGTPPVLTMNSTASIYGGSNFFGWRLENLELVQTGASGNIVAPGNGGRWLLDRLSITDGGGVGFLTTGSNTIFVGCEFANLLGDGFSGSGASYFFHGCYIHDNGGIGIAATSASSQISLVNCIVESNTGKGIAFSSAAAGNTLIGFLIGNTIYGNGDSGLEVTDTEPMMVLFNNIFSQNGNAAGEYNVEGAGALEVFGFHRNNVFYHSGGGGGANLSNLTTNSTEVTTDPLFTDAANGDFSISSLSPAKAAGFPGSFPLDGLSVGYLDIGAVQREEAGTSGGSFTWAG